MSCVLGDSFCCFFFSLDDSYWFFVQGPGFGLREEVIEVDFGGREAIGGEFFNVCTVGGGGGAVDMHTCRDAMRLMGLIGRGEGGGAHTGSMLLFGLEAKTGGKMIHVAC